MDKKERVVILALLMLFLLCLDIHAAGETIRIGVYNNSPKIYLTEAGPTGFWIDILDYVKRKEDWRLEYIEGDWNTLTDKLDKGEIDILPDVATSKERESRWEFNDESIFITWSEVYVAKDSHINSFIDMENKKVGVLTASINYIGDRGIKALLEGFDISCEFVEFPSYDAVFDAVNKGIVDVAVANRIFGENNKEKYKLKNTPMIFQPSTLKFAFSKKNPMTPKLINTIDLNIKDLKMDVNSIYYMSLKRLLLSVDVENITLTPAEERFIKDHPVIRVGFDPGFAPFEYAQGLQYNGIAADHINIISKITGIRFEIASNLSWEEVIKRTENRKIDVLPAVGITEKRKQYLNFTRPYLSYYRVIITQASSDVRSFDDLKGLKVGVQVDSSHHGFMVENNFPEPMLYPTFQDAIIALSSGYIDAVIGNLGVASHTIVSLQLTNLKIAGYSSQEPSYLSIAVRKDWPELVSIFDKTLDSMAKDVQSDIISRWVPLQIVNDIGAITSIIDLTPYENTWLAEHKEIRLGADPDWLPYDFIDDLGEHQGICHDFTEHFISRKLNVSFKNPTKMSWDDMMEKARKGEIDMIPCITKTDERSEFLAFTEPYLTLPIVIVTRGDMIIKNLSDMEGKTMAVVKGYPDMLSKDFPSIILIPVDSVEESFRAVSEGIVDGTLNTIETTRYMTKHLKITNTKISGITPYNIELSIGVRKDWPEMISILEKAIACLPERYLKDIEDKWANVLVQKEIDKVYIIKVALIISAIALTCISIFLSWNRILKKEINERKKAQKKLQYHEKHLEEEVKGRTKELSAAYERLKSIDQMKNNIINNVSHELRTPLTIVQSAIDLADNAKTKEDKHRFLVMIKKALARQDKVISNLLEVASVEKKDIKIFREKIDLKEIVNIVLGENSSLADEREVRLLAKVPSIKANIDFEKTKRILSNLIDNAIKFSDTGGKVKISVKQDKHMIKFAVADEGIGIDKKYHKKIFERLYQIDPSSSRIYGGTGMGLTLAKKFVDICGGKIWVTSKPNKGSTFYFTVPIR